MTSSKWSQILVLMCSLFLWQFSKIETSNSINLLGPLQGEPQQPNFPKCGNYKVRALTRIPSLLGMCPSYDDGTRSVYFTDAFRQAVLRYFIDTGVLVSAEVLNVSPIGSASGLLNGTLPTNLEIPVKFLGFIIPSNVRNKYVMNFGDEFGVLSWDGLSPLALFNRISIPDPAHRFPFFVLFGGKVGPNGVLFFYSVPVPFGNLLPVNPIPGLTRPNESSLFGICNGKLKTLLIGFTFGNGLGFSPCGCWFYHDDSVRKIVYRTHYDKATCTMSNTTVLLDFNKANIRGLPDGLTVDNQGYVYVTCVSAGQVIKIDPETGNVICAIYVPANEVSDATFGRCPGSYGPPKCMYLTTGLDNNGTISTNGIVPALDDGDLLLVSDFGAVGQFDQRVNLMDVTNSATAY